MNVSLPVLLLKAVQLSITATLACCFLPFVWIGSKIYHRPPNVAHFRQLLRFLRYVWTANPSDPAFPPGYRVWMTLVCSVNYFGSILAGAAWILDEILFGQQFDHDVSIDQPLFLLSATRSGSTQLARYLEHDPNLMCPSLAMTMFPYLWLWKLVPITIGRFITKEQVQSKLLDMMPTETKRRHEIDPFQSDTFDPAFLTSHLNSNALQLGPTIGAVEFNFAEFAPHNRSLIEEDYLQFIDRIGRKTLLYHKGYNHHNNNPRRFFLKGHFLQAGPALSSKYPDCSMLAVVRDPLPRLQSGIHFICVNPIDPFLGCIPWNWIARMLESTEARYCEIEQEWFTSNTTTSVTKCVVHFEDYIQDLPGVMKTIYKECLGLDTPPPDIPLKHAPKERNNYSVNRSLKELGIDEEALKRRLASYIQWIGTIKKNR